MARARTLRLRDVRSYEEEELQLGPVLTVIHGPNGAGKTNLLEALYFACTGRSCRTSNAREFIRFGQPAARVELDVEDADGLHELAIGFEPGSPRRVSADGGIVERLGDVPFRPLACVFLPDDLELVKGSPGVRRDHLDRLVAGLWPARAAVKAEYARALAQRNALLARIRSGAAGPEAIAAWDLELGRHAIALRDTRLEAVEAVRTSAGEISVELGLPGGLELSYRPRSEAQEPEEFARELQAAGESKLHRYLARRCPDGLHGLQAGVAKGDGVPAQLEVPGRDRLGPGGTAADAGQERVALGQRPGVLGLDRGPGG
ncbi:MAG: DNA replication/repair protein RecF, partial [Solirubrobacterales bacterium]